MMRLFMPQWNTIEVKASERIKVMTYADSDIVVWQPVTLQDLAVHAQFGGVVISRDRVSDFHSALDAYHHWACPQPGKLP